MYIHHAVSLVHITVCTVCTCMMYICTYMCISTYMPSIYIMQFVWFILCTVCMYIMYIHTCVYLRICLQSTSPPFFVNVYK